MSDMELAVVTGAGQGIGLAAVERLLADGFHVVMVDRNAEPLGTAARPINPVSVQTSASTVGLPRLSRISRANISRIALIS